MTKRSLIILLVVVSSLAATVMAWRYLTRSTPIDIAPSQQETSPTTNSQTFNKNQHSATDPSSIWVVVNKSRPLSEPQFSPNDLIVPDVKLRLDPSAEQMQARQIIHQPLKDLFAAGKVAGFDFAFGSGYRSYALQQQFYQEYVRTMGETEANRTSARAGASEHQTGLSFDIEATGQKCHLDKCLADLPDGKWLAEHAHEHGFIIRYPLGKESITGYDFEPWHLRYVGKELASQLHSSNKTMEEFFGIN